MNALSNFIKGIFIGSGAILPGISSGVICMVVGLYEKLLDSILNFFKDIRKNSKFLFPIILGGFVGIILFSNILSYCLNTIPCQTKSLFIGLLLGSTFILAKSNLSDDISIKTNKSRYFSLLICFFIGLSLICLENIVNTPTEYTTNEFSTPFLVLSGFFMSIGIVVPGVSSTVILMILGVYSTYLSALSIVNMSVLFPIMLGAGIGSIIFMKIIQKLLTKYHSQTIFCIIGFSLGSIFILYPGYTFSIESLISLLLLVLGFFIGKNLEG